MTALAAGLLIVPLVDQGLKAILRRTLGLRSFSLGWFGSLRVKEAQIWWVRLGRNSNMAMIWLLWLFAAGAVATLTVLCPSCGWFAGLLMGGSISHGLESSIRGRTFRHSTSSHGCGMSGLCHRWSSRREDLPPARIRAGLSKKAVYNCPMGFEPGWMERVRRFGDNRPVFIRRSIGASD